MRLRAFVAAAVLAVAAPAFAQSGPQTDSQADQSAAAPEQGQHHAMSPEAREAMRKACAADIQTYCADTEKGGGRLGQCLRQNFDKLSGDCQTQLKEMRSHWRHDQPPQQQPQ